MLSLTKQTNSCQTEEVNRSGPVLAIDSNIVTGSRGSSSVRIKSFKHLFPLISPLEVYGKEIIVCKC